jgi:transposase
MTYVGMDVHKNTSTLAFIDPATAQIETVRVPTNPREIARALNRWERPWVVALEATRQAPAVCKWLRAMFADEIHLADPQKLEAIGKCGSAKTDAKDAELIREALRDGYLPEAYLASAQVEDLRALSRGRQQFRQVTTKLRNILRTLLSQAGLTCSWSDLCGVAARGELKELFGQLAPFARQIAEGMWAALERIEELLRDIQREVERQAKADPIARELMRLPGIGATLALSIRAEIGEIERFASPEKLISYAGLAPRPDDSDRYRGRRRLPKRCQKRLRYLAVLAAQGAARSREPSRPKAVYERHRARLGPQTAKIAAARRMLTEVFELWPRQPAVAARRAA